MIAAVLLVILFLGIVYFLFLLSFLAMFLLLHSILLLPIHRHYPILHQAILLVHRIPVQLAVAILAIVLSLLVFHL